MRLPERFVICALVCALFWAQLLSVEATNIKDIQQQINQSQNNLDKVNNQLSQYEAELAERRMYLDDMKSEMMNLMKDVAYFENAVAEKEEAIRCATTELEDASALREEQYAAMMKRIQFMYESGDDNYLMILLTSQDFTDLLNRAEYVDSVYSYDRAMLEGYEALVSDIGSMRDTLEMDKAELVLQQKSLDAQKTELDRIMAELEDQVSDYDALVADAKAKAANYKSQIAKGQQQIQIIQQQQSKPTAKPSGGSSGGDTVVGSGTGAEVAEYALQFVGNPYVWGGSSLTEGADCSGFIMAVYAQFGYALPHSSFSMRSIGKGVELGEAQAGDIICYSGHVGLYIGNGRIVHAKGDEYGIVTDPVYYGWGGAGPKVLAVRRIIKD